MTGPEEADTGAGDTTAPPPLPRRRRRRRRRRLAIVLAIAGLLLVLAGAGAAAGLDLLRAKDDMTEARATLKAIVDDPASLRTTEGRLAARSAAQGASARIARARQRLDDSWGLKVVGVVPGLSTQRRGAVRLVRDAGTATDVGLGVLEAVDDVAEREQLRGGAVPLRAMGELRVLFDRATQQVVGTDASDGGLWGPLAEARRELNDVTRKTSRRLGEVAEGLGAAETFLGRDGPRRYLVAMHNNAEMRDQGMVLSYALVGVESGRLTVERSGSIYDVFVERPVVPLPPGTEKIFGALAPNQDWRSVNATADYAWSGRTMAEMIRAATGQAVDGVIGIDVPALAALLRSVGPVDVPGLDEPISADNAADLLLNRFYDDFPVAGEQRARKEALGDVFAAIVARLVGGSYDAIELGTRLGDAAAGGHLRLWSANAAEEEVFERRGLGGGPAVDTPDRTIHVSVQNATATKLDYVVRPRLNLDVSLTPEGAARVDAEVVVANTAPPGLEPSYRFGPDGVTQDKPGQYVTRVYFWGPRGAEQADSVDESGLRLNQGPTTVNPGEEQSVRFTTTIPAAVRRGRVELRLVPQARLEPMPLRVTLTAPGWRVDGPATVEPNWDRTVTVSWPVARSEATAAVPTTDRP